MSRTSRSQSPRRRGRSSSSVCQDEDEDNENRQSHQRNAQLVNALIEFRGNCPRDPILDEIHKPAKEFGRNYDLFLEIYPTISLGLRLHQMPEDMPIDDDEELESLSSEERAKTTADFKRLLAVIPPLKDELQAIEDEPDALLGVVRVISKARDMARREDSDKLRYPIILLLPRVLSLQHLGETPLKTDQRTKCSRGFKHHSTGRLLVPRQHRDEYDADPSRYCASVIDRSTRITADDMPSFLYPENEYDPNAVVRWLFHGPLFIMAYGLVWNGAQSTAVDEPIGGRLGRRPIGYKSRPVTAERVAYVATLLRFTLSTQNQWGDIDGAFSNRAFYYNILKVFELDMEWAQQTLKHIELEVWGVLSEQAAGNMTTEPTGFMAMMATQRALAASQRERDMENGST